MTVKEWRTKHGVSQFELAVRAGITPGTIAHIERGGGCTTSSARGIIKATNGEVGLDDLVPVEPSNGPPAATG